MEGTMAEKRKRGNPISLVRTMAVVLMFGTVAVIVAVLVYVGTKQDDSATRSRSTNCLHDAIVPVQWLHRKLGQFGNDGNDCLIVLDAGTFYGGHDLYLEGHIPGAYFLNNSQCLPDPSLTVEDMPDMDCFENYARRLGISQHTHVVVYERIKNMVATRIWWNFKLFGHDKVSVLDGGMAEWIKQGYMNSTNVPLEKEGDFHIHYNPKMWLDFDGMADIVNNTLSQIVDSRDPEEFKGTITIKGFKTGHMPGAVNVPFQEILNEDDTFKSASQLKQLFVDRGVDLTKPIVSTCRTGIYSTSISAVLHSLGIDNVPSYDGSWQDWGRRANAHMVVTG